LLNFIHFDIFDSQLGVVLLEGRYIFQLGLRGIVDKFNSHFCKLVGTWIFKLVEVKGVYPWFLDCAIKAGSQDE